MDFSARLLTLHDTLAQRSTSSTTFLSIFDIVFSLTLPPESLPCFYKNLHGETFQRALNIVMRLSALRSAIQLRVMSFP